MTTQSSKQLSNDGQVYTWTPLTTASPDGDGACFQGAGDRSIQVSGTFGAGTVVVEGSMDGANWFPLRDPSSTPISFIAGGIKAILENVLFLRPRVTGADGTTSITAMLFVRRSANG